MNDYRQQKNYLVRLGLITELADSYIAITDIGKSWLLIRSEFDLRRAFKAIMDEIRWTWCNMPFFAFSRQVALRCDGYISYRELFNWVIHAYNQSQLDEVVTAVRTSRQLPDYQLRSLNTYIETKLHALLDRHMSGAAFGHYRTKIRDLMEAFATTGDFALKGNGDFLKVVLTEQGRR